MNNCNLSILCSIACSAEATEVLLASLETLSLSSNIPFLFCIDGHVDQLNKKILSDFIAKRSKTSKIIFNDSPRGYSISINRLFEASNTEFSLLIDSDVMLTDECISNLMRHMEDGKVSSVQPVLIYPQTMKIQSYGHIFGKYFNKHALTGLAYEESKPLPSREAQGITTACQMIRTKLFHKVGGLDEDYYNAYDGLELSLKFRKLGYKTIVAGDAKAYHFQGKTRSTLSLNESIATAIFWTRWEKYIEIDFDQFFRPSDWPHLPQTKIINLSNLQDWNQIPVFRETSREDYYCVRSRGIDMELWEELPIHLINYPGLLIFLCDSFTQVVNNEYWFYRRGSNKTVILDMHGNQLIR